MIKCFFKNLLTVLLVGLYIFGACLAVGGGFCIPNTAPFWWYLVWLGWAVLFVTFTLTLGH